KLFGEGATVGPELTGYERDNIRYWLDNIVDPSAQIRDEYLAFVVDTKDGRTLTGIIAAQDKATVTLKLSDAQQVRLAREQIEELRASPFPIMPEAVQKALKDKQIRAFFPFLMTNPKKKTAAAFWGTTGKHASQPKKSPAAPSMRPPLPWL